MSWTIEALLLAHSQFYDPGMNDTTRDRIKTWLTERGYKVGKADSRKGVLWMLDAQQGKSGFRFSVGVIEKMPDSILVMASAPFDDYQLQLQSLTAKRHKELLFKLKFRLLSIEGIKFDLPDDLSKVSVTDELFIEELTRGGFWRTVAQISKAVSCAVFTFEEQFQPVSISDSNGGGH